MSHYNSTGIMQVILNQSGYHSLSMAEQTEAPMTTEQKRHFLGVLNAWIMEDIGIQRSLQAWLAREQQLRQSICQGQEEHERLRSEIVDLVSRVEAAGGVYPGVGELGG
ncbi:unnamed protein product [Tuber aestivum]|uniref:Uncharacterized protein n=1 Tax=Tuber aestivum TaxID=59557 RepID=A0A292PKP5_9PEZI|nr:unnamed protein product [Tuber aestivum]